MEKQGKPTDARYHLLNEYDRKPMCQDTFEFFAPAARFANERGCKLVALMDGDGREILEYMVKLPNGLWRRMKPKDYHPNSDIL